MNSRHTEGIVLKGMPFQDYDRILTLFSQDTGIIKLIIKGANKPQSGAFPITLLTHAEFVYTSGKSELFKCNEACVINHHLALRESLPRLEAACDMAQAILASQMPQTPAPALFELFTHYLNNMQRVQHPQLLAGSFRLKILRHEGLFKISQSCALCQCPLQTFHLAEGDTFCSQHAPPHQIPFDEEEMIVLAQLAYCRTFSELAEITLTDTLRGKINALSHFVES